MIGATPPPDLPSLAGVSTSQQPLLPPSDARPSDFLPPVPWALWRGLGKVDEAAAFSESGHLYGRRLKVAPEIVFFRPLPLGWLLLGASFVLSLPERALGPLGRAWSGTRSFAPENSRLPGQKETCFYRSEFLSVTFAVDSASDGGPWNPLPAAHPNVLLTPGPLNSLVCGSEGPLGGERRRRPGPGRSHRSWNTFP